MSREVVINGKTLTGVPVVNYEIIHYKPAPTLSWWQRFLNWMKSYGYS